jgi:hypothetical protein
MHFVGADPWVALVFRRGTMSPCSLALNHAGRRSSPFHRFTYAGSAGRGRTLSLPRPGICHWVIRDRIAADIEKRGQRPREIHPPGRLACGNGAKSKGKSVIPGLLATAKALRRRDPGTQIRLRSFFASRPSPVPSAYRRCPRRLLPIASFSWRSHRTAHFCAPDP